jgi:capsular exopolysaccharide synthesis family protein
MDDELKQMMNNQPPENEPFDLMEYWRIFDPYKWHIIIFTAVVAIASVYYALSLTPQYTATVKLMFESDRANTVSIREIYDADNRNRNYISTQTQILQSRELAERVIKELDLLNKADYDQLLPLYSQMMNVPGDSLETYLQTGYQDDNEPSPELVEQMAMRDAVEIFQGKLTFEPVWGTDLINISYDSADPQLAAEVANGLADIYILSHRESIINREAEIKAWMNERMETNKVALSLAENALQDFLAKEGLVDTTGISTLAQRELDDLSAERNEIRARVRSTKTIYDLTQSQTTIEEMMSLPDLLDNAVIRQIKNSEIEANQSIIELSQRYGPKHPRMIAARERLNKIQSTLATEVQNLVSGISTEYSTAVADLQAIEQKIENAKSELQRISSVEREYKKLKGEVEINEQLFNQFFTRLKETSEIQDFPKAVARVLDKAIPPQWPSKPSKKKIVVFATGGAFAFATGLVFVLSFLSGGIRTLDDIERRLRQRMLGLIPKQKLNKKDILPNDIFFDSEAKGFTEAIRTIRTSLLMSMMDNPAKVIAVTSSIPGEGKTTLSTNLAYALGQMERVLLIDCDLRRPSLGKQFGYPPYHPGLSNLIANTANLSSCIVKDQKSGIDLLLAGAIPPNPQELLSSDLMKTAMKLLTAKYDRIIIDTAPTQAVADSLIVSTHADAMIYVVKADSTHYKNIKSGIGRLLQVGANVAGVVLNQVDLEQSSRYGDYEGYYDQYGYNEDSQQVLDSQPRSDDKEQQQEEETANPPRFR